MYLGEPALVFFIKDYTKKIKSKLLQMEMQEQVHIDRQVENFTATVSHEMRNPVATSLFFLAHVLKAMMQSSINPTAVRYTKLVINQLHFL